MQLTTEEQKRVNREFAAHFEISDFPEEVNITPRLVHIVCKSDDSFTIKQLFHMVIGRRLKYSNREAARKCNEWADKHTLLLHELEKIREKGENK